MKNQVFFFTFIFQMNQSHLNLKGHTLFKITLKNLLDHFPFAFNDGFYNILAQT
jgi:hypothetical protein